MLQVLKTRIKEKGGFGVMYLLTKEKNYPRVILKDAGMNFITKTLKEQMLIIE